MIATLSGRITEKLTDAVILEVGGIGYEVFTSAEELTKLSTGSSIQLYIYDHIREDLHSLYGFKKIGRAHV